MGGPDYRPKLKDGSYLVLAGTDNDFSVTQNDSSAQFDVYFKPVAGSQVSHIRCDIGSFSNCFEINAEPLLVQPYRQVSTSVGIV